MSATAAATIPVGQILATETPDALHPNIAVIQKTGIEFPRRLPFGKWLHVGRVLSTVHSSTAWCLGDWLAFGEDTYVGRYRDAVELCSLRYQTLRNYAWVSRRFPLSRRRDKLSFGHHAEVAALPEPEQDYWLRMAEELGWSRNQLRKEVRASLTERGEPRSVVRGRTGPAEAPVLLAEGTSVQLNVAAEEFELWSAAAARANLSVTAWAVSALDEAAERRAARGL
ncbi:MAG: LmbU family transcriptional regulator [Nonomuraea sp.]|nr:LmbU family transcriptional regulator [Nonomuraea sp.]NUP64363.1 LmbU family transcriptional regulator [Nonomuraea sp.]